MVISYTELLSQNCKPLVHVGLCTESNCKAESHVKDCCDMYDMLTSMLISVDMCVRKNSKLRKYKIQPGWNNHVKVYYDIYRKSYNAWVQNGKKKVGPECEYMNSCRKSFKSKLRQCRQSEEMQKANALVKDFMTKDFVRFWSRVKLYDKKQSAWSNKVDGYAGSNDICAFWADKYETHFSLPDDSIEQEEERRLFEKLDRTFLNNNARFFTSDTISSAIKKIGLGNSTGPDGLQAEHFRFAPPIVCSLLASVFNSCLAHSVLPDKLMAVNILPIVKKKGLDAKDSQNYRPIALATAASKILEHALFEKISTHLGIYSAVTGKAYKLEHVDGGIPL